MQITLSNKTLELKFRFPETRAFFERFEAKRPQEDENSICLSERDWDALKQQRFDISPYTEYTYFPAPISDELLPFDRCVIHAAAIRYRDRAWLLAGPSGVGKSTQIRSLQSLETGAFGVICGDRPVLELREDGSVMVWPSPWNGKENWHGAEAAPLGGLILLRRGPENRLYALREDEAILNLYVAFIQTSASVEAVTKVADLEDGVLRAVPTWLLVSDTVPDSTRCLVEGIFS